MPSSRDRGVPLGRLGSMAAGTMVVAATMQGTDGFVAWKGGTGRYATLGRPANATHPPHGRRAVDPRVLPTGADDGRTVRGGAAV
jgi:hypothetical protein